MLGVVAIVIITAALVVVLAPGRPTLVLATTTSVYDSGLLDEILPDFESKYGFDVKVVAVGTGQALEYGRRGDADVLLVHSPADEINFVNQGHGLYRETILWNTFLVVGPRTGNPADLNATDKAGGAFQKIFDTGSEFVSRADNSGTNKKELSIWKSLGITQEQLNGSAWYSKIGQGMGETLTFANEQTAYTLSDEGTWYSMEDNLANLRVYVDNDTALLNYYSVMPVNGTMHPNVHSEGAGKFVEWLSSDTTLDRIEQFTVNGHVLFKKFT